MFISFNTKNIGTREQAKTIRHQMEKTDETICIDFRNVECVSNCFADELFGKFANKIGAKEFAKRMQFTNSNDTIVATVNNAIEYRLQHTC